MDNFTRIAKASGLDVPEGSTIVGLFDAYMEKDMAARESPKDALGYQRMIHTSAEALAVAKEALELLAYQRRYQEQRA